MLSPYRVLDLTNERGQLAGAMLAYLGAEVIAIEPPGGSPTRHRGPFAGDEPHPDHSVTHWAYNRGKQSVVLDVAGSPEQRAAFVELVAGTDVLIESGTPGELDAFGLGYDDLAAINPALVYASISPFGQTGPRSGWVATDLTVWASAGPLAVTGDDDRAPVRPSVPQAWAHAASEAAGAIIAALYERGSSGLGQHLDISAQQACAQATQSTILAASNNSTIPQRGAGRIKVGPLVLQLLWACSDGHVSITFLFGTALGPATTRLMDWIHEEGFCDEATRDKDWVGYGQLLMTGAEPLSEFDRVKDVVTAFCSQRTKAELIHGALERRLLIAPVLMVDDVMHAEQLESRNYWDDVDGVRFPGAFARLSETPLDSPGRPPRLGAHTSQILHAPARQRTSSPPVEPPPTSRPLEGLKVLDLMWVMAGPAVTRVLTDLGATVIRVESSHRIDTARTLLPFKDEENALETSVLFSNLNAGKRGIAVDPSSPEGRAVILDLVAWADVVTESFSPKAMRGWGLDYDQLRTVNPGVIMMSSCLFGQTGPLSGFAGYGTMAAAMSGFFGVTGWPDRAPCGPFGAYTDYISPRFAVATLLAALDHRRRTGVGQYIDFAQAEGALHALAPAIIEYSANGRIWPRVGNDDADFHPHGVFASSGDDRWIALACTNDEQRAALSAIAGSLDASAITSWTSTLSPDEATDLLQAHSIASYPVHNGEGLTADPQLVARGHFVTVPHPVMGAVTIEASRVRMSRTPSRVDTAGPMLGQHTFEVLTEVLGYDDERIADLLVAGVLE